MRLAILAFSFVFVFISCSSSGDSKQDYESPQILMESIPTVQPAKIVEFSGVDTLFFGFIGADTVPFDDGSFGLTDPQSGFVVHIDSSGKFIKKVAGHGRGPSEFLDGLFLQPRPGGGFALYDQRSKKIGLFGPDAEYENEKVLRSSLEGITRVFELGNNKGFLVESTDFSMQPNSGDDRKKVFSIINEGVDKISNQVKTPAQEYVVIGAGGSARALPHANRQLLRYRPQTQTFITFWSGSDTLAEINAQFDTLQNIALNIPPEQFTQAEIDSMSSQNSSDWDAIKEKLPYEKTPVQDMRLGPNNTFWLKLSYRSDFDQWLIADSSGTPQKIVQLPKSTMLTHVSKHHLGVRMGPGTFALYAPVE